MIGKLNSWRTHCYNSKTMKPILSVCFFIALYIQFGLCGQENCLKPSCIETSEIEELTQESYQLTASISSLTSQQDTLSDELQDLSKKITDLTTENEKLKQQNDEQQVEIEALQLSLNDLETLLNELSLNVTTAWNSVTSLSQEVLDLSETLADLNATTENLQTGYNELNSALEDFEVRSSSLVEVFETVIPPDVGTLTIPAETCKWVQVFVDVESSAEHAVTYGLLYKDGYPIDGGLYFPSGTLREQI